jgi:hypothetical protein
MVMRDASLRRGDMVEVKSPAEILATLDERGMLEGLPFMPEMLQFAGRRFTVDKRADKLCDTIGDYTSRKMPGTVLLEDLRCDGSGHDGCQAECRLFWKEQWLRRVEPGAPPAPATAGDDSASRAALAQRAARGAQSTSAAGGESKTIHVCQATELNRASFRLSTYDPRPYVRELTGGNVGFGRFLRVLARAIVEQPLHKLGRLPVYPLRGTRRPGTKDPALGLRPGEIVRVKSPAEIATTLTPDGRNRGLWFDREMLPFCGGTYRVRQRVKKFIDERTGEMIELKTDSLTLEGVACSGERSTSRWFCPRAIYPYWREAWLQRVDGAPSDASPTAESEMTEPVHTQPVEHVGLAQVAGPTAPPGSEAPDADVR